MKLTIHRALSELKLIDSRIAAATNEILPSATHQKEKKIGGYMTQDEFKAKAQGAYDSALALIKRKAMIKSKIVESNATTKIKVGEKEMSVADAITEKTNIKLKKTFLDHIKKQHKAVLALMNQNNQNVEKNCQIILEHTFGKDNTKVGRDDMDAVRKPFMEQNEFHLFDPLQIEDKISAMEKEINQFETEIDACLSESNAITFIEVE